MKNKQDNRKLYEQILNASSQEDLQSIKTLTNGYECFCSWSISDSYSIAPDGSGIEIGSPLPNRTVRFLEEQYNDFYLESSQYCYRTGGIGSPGGQSEPVDFEFLIGASLPPWIGFSLIGHRYDPLGNGTEISNVYRLSGTAPSYETISAFTATGSLTPQESDCGDFRWPNIYYYMDSSYSAASGVGCSGLFDLRVADVNEPPLSNNISNIWCLYDKENGDIVGSITITDTDTKTEGLRWINGISINGPISNYVNSDFTPGYTPKIINFTLKNKENISPTTTITGEVVFYNPYRQNSECTLPPIFHPIQSGTANISVTFLNELFLSTPIPLGNVKKRRGRNDVFLNNYFPTGLNNSKEAFLGYYGTSDGSGCMLPCEGYSGINSYPLVYNVYGSFPNNINVHEFYTHYSDQNYFGIKLEDNRDIKNSYTGILTIQGSGSYNEPTGYPCCDPLDIDLYHYERQSQYGLGIYHTGMGPQIEFSGGIGNVEGSYFIGGLDQLATNDLVTIGETTYTLGNKLAIIPNNSGVTFGSSDDSFFLYTFGRKILNTFPTYVSGGGLEKITHSSETGIIEADGFDNYIAIRYASSNQNTFYSYNIATSEFSSGITPFISDIQRIIAIDNRFWILGNDESVLFNPQNNSYVSVNHNNFTGISGIGPNISVISPYSFDSCSVVSTVDENYIFAVGTGYDSSNSHFPLLLDTVNNQISPHSSSSFINDINLSGYYVDYYLNYRPDIIQNLHRIIISAEETATNTTRLLACDMNRSGTMSIVAESPSGKSHKRVSELINNLVLWAGSSGNTETVVVDTFGENYTTFYDILEITGSISIAKSNYNEYTTLLLSEYGNSGYIISDYDLETRNILSFTGTPNMGYYGDIALATGSEGGSSLGGNPNFLLLPKTTYETNEYSGSLAVLSTRTIDFDFTLHSDIGWNLDETLIRNEAYDCNSDLVTPSAIPIATFRVIDDEFYYGNTISLPSGSGDNSSFSIDFADNNLSGTIKINPCLALDYETKRSYTGIISSVDPYYGDSVSFREFVLNIQDVNESPILTDLEYTTCFGQYSEGMTIGTITITDPDILTPGNRFISSVNVQGVGSEFIDIDYVQGSSTITVKLKNVDDIGTTPNIPIVAEIVATNPYFNGITYDESASTTTYGTGTVTVNLVSILDMETPDKLGNLRKRRGSANNHVLPTGLSFSKPIFLGYYGTSDGPGCASSCDNDSNNYASIFFIDDSIVSNSSIEIKEFTKHNTYKNYFGVQIESGRSNTTNYTGVFTAAATGINNSCCDPDPLTFSIVETQSTNGLGVVKTGVGPDIDFTGGVGNVEGSYFIGGLYDDYPVYSLRNKLAIIPSTSGIGFDSQDSAFYLYTFGVTGIEEVSHISETGIIEADGFGKYIAIRYKSSSSNTFYVYDIENDTFTSSISPFSSDIKRLIGLHHPISSRSINKFWILGNDESVLYDPVTNTYSSVNHNQFVGSSGIPENISVLPTRQFASCLGELKGGENYIFAVGTGYDGSNDYFPVVLQGNNLVSHTGSSYISGISLSGYYLDSYLNYRTDIVQNLHRLIISAENTDLNQTQLLACDMDRSGEMSIVAKSPLGQRHKRASELINNLVLWAGDSATSETVAVDTFGSDPLTYYDTLDITGEISIAKPNYNQYTTLLLAQGGESGYTVSDYDLDVINRLTFTGDLDMGRYGDIALATGAAGFPNGIGGKPNFLLLPTTTYETNTISGSLVAISTSTTAYLDVIFSTGEGDFEIDETVVVGAAVSYECGEGPQECCGSDLVTPSAIVIGTFIVTDDEFDGGNTIGLPAGQKDNDIFTIDITGNSGTISVKSCLAFDYETRNTYTGVITGVDPYFIDQPPFSREFVLNIRDVDEPPTDITITPDIQTVAANVDLSEDLLVATIVVDDEDITDIDDSSGFQTNIVEIADGINKQYFRVSSDYTQLYLRKDSVLDSETEYQITLLVRGLNFSSYTASATFTLNVTGYAPVGIFMNPVTTSINENTPLPTLRHLADISLNDPDSTDDNEIVLTGPDAVFFTISYTGVTNTGNLYLNAGVDLDFETKTSYTGTLLARVFGTTNPFVTRNFILNINDVDEPTGIRFTPNIVYIDETTGNTTNTILASLSLTEPFEGENLVITDLAYTTGGYRSALDKFTIASNQTATPDLVFLSDTVLDYESDPILYIIASGYPEGQSNIKLGGLITVVVNDIDEPPQISFSPTGLSITETTDTNLGSFKLANIKVQDEQQSTVTLSLTGEDAEYFTIIPSSVVVDDPTSSISIGQLNFNSGVSLDFNVKNTYTGQIIATDGSDISSTGTFLLRITDVGECFLEINGSGYDVVCPQDTNGYILLDVRYTGDGAATCNVDRPLSLDWKNLPDGVTTEVPGTYVYGLGTGIYNATVLGGTIPLRSVSYSISSSTQMEITNVILNQIPCESSGSITVSFTGGKPPYFVDYNGSIQEIEENSQLIATIPVNGPSSGNIIVTDINNCAVSGGPYVFNFPSARSYSFDSQSAPLIHDDILSSYKFEVSHDAGPYEINVYNSTTGEKGSLFTVIDRYDTTVLSSIRQIGEEILDASGNVQVQISNDLFANPLVYSYDIGSKIYPGSYVFEFINQNGCSFLTDLQTASNIEPLSTNISTVNNTPFDLGVNVISQPILDTLFIPYRLIVNDSDILSYISNITEKSDIRFEIGGNIFDRNALYGTLSCDTYSLVNIKFLGLKSNEWYFTIPFYRGFDISDTTEVDVLNQDIFLVISENKKIKIVTELNNNINTIKLLKGSLLTTDTSLDQFKPNRELQLTYFNDGEFENVAVAKVGTTYTLHNKHIPGNIFMVDFLQNTDISEDLNSNDLESVSFDCNVNQKTVADYRKFVIELNNFDNYTNIYFKTQNNYEHNGFINLNIAGGYPDNVGNYKIEYRYYDKATKRLLNIFKNNTIVRNENVLDDIKDGTYIVKVTDTYGNKLKLVNGLEYDSFFSKMIDYILNELKTTKEALGFQYGDLLVNVYNTLTYPSAPPASIPGTEPEPEEELTENPTIVITTTTHQVSPNTSYNNLVTIQTDPGKVKFVVSGPYGYRKIFDDRVELIQLPPGVYNIEGYEPDLLSKYLYQDRRKIFVNTSSVILIDLSFDFYQDTIIIE